MKRRHSEPRATEQDSKWARPPLPPDFAAATHSVTFQQMEIKYVLEQARPVIKMFGCSQEGHSVAVSVHNFAPYLYVVLEAALEAEQCDQFRDALDAALRRKLGEQHDYGVRVAREQKMSIMYYREQTQPFLKITLSSPKYVPSARSVLEEGLALQGQLVQKYATFESNVLYVLRYMVDRGIGGASWVQLPAGKYELVPPEERECSTSIVARIHYEQLVAYAVDDEAWAHNAPLRVLSFDIECAGRPGIFPEPAHDPVIQIANYVAVQGEEKHMVNIFVLGSCTPITGVEVRCFESERELLQAWSRFIVQADPDLLTGYNIVNFDLGYLTERARALRLRDFDQFTRVTERRASVKDSKFSSAQTGTRESKEWSIDGRIVFDMYQVVQRDHKLSSYTLNNVASHFLQQQKEDVHHSQITVLHQGTADDRRRLAVYCCKDALLPLRLIESQMSLVNYVEMARVTGVPFAFLLSRGQGIKVLSQILRKTRQLGVLVPTLGRDEADGQEDVGFTGAKVLDPRVGFYDTPILTLDFASLYPSIMQAHNLCYTTLLPPGRVPPHLVEGVDYATSPMGHRFVLATRKTGVLTMILKELLSARSGAKRLMAAATDPAKQKVYNGRQLALKVSANSVYGFTGQAHGAIPCVEISSSVTSYGREMIMLTKRVVEEEFCIANGYAHDAQVIYGDTDSVMVYTGVKTVGEAIELGLKGAKLVTTKFPSPIKLEFEKVYYPYLLMSKKKYAGMFYTKPDHWDKMDSKGIESVRRDNCGIVRYVVEEVLRKLLIQQDIEGSLALCKTVIANILQNKVDLSLLIVTKAYSREADAYKSPQAHIALAAKMAKRDPATAPRVGDRIPYVIVQGEKKGKMFEKAEDPLYVLANDVPIDAQYYIRQLIAPLCRILSPIVENPQSMLTLGEHTRHRVLTRPKSAQGAQGGLAAFVVVRENCLACRAPLAQGEHCLCAHCRPHCVDIYAKYLGQLREKEMQFGRLWTHCQDCQGNRQLEVICSANDCPIFYKRTKTHKELMEAHKAIYKFDAMEW